MGFLNSFKGKIILGMSLGAGAIVAGAVVFTLIMAPKDYRSIKVNGLTGTTVITDESNVSENAYKGMNLESGDKVMVETDSNMTLLFDADKYMFADEGTKFKVVASGNSKKATTKTKIVLEDGSVLCRIDTKLKDEEVYEIETPNSTMSVRGTLFKMSVYKDEKGENYTKIDVLEGSVKVDLHMEDGEKTGEEGLIEAGQAATVHSNPDISEFVVGESTISYEDFTEEMANFVVKAVDEGREICIEKELFKHFTGLEKEHTPGDWKVEEEAPCVERLRCKECNAIMEEREIDFDKHDLERETIEKQEGCTLRTIVQDVCKACKMTKEISSQEEVKHTYGDWKITKDVTCTTAGVRQMVCSVCGDTISENITEKGHSYSDWNVTASASCTAAGVQERTCSTCGEKETSAVAALGHNYKKLSEVAAGCMEAGESKDKCDRCGDVVTTTFPAVGHTNVYSHEDYVFDYASNGFTVSYVATCATCGDSSVAAVHSGVYYISNSGYAETTCECGHTSSVAQ